MADRLPPLSCEVGDAIDKLGNVDVLVGIPSFNNERTIGHVVRAVVAGLARHFPDATGGANELPDEPDCA